MADALLGSKLNLLQRNSVLAIAAAAGLGGGPLLACMVAGPAALIGGITLAAAGLAAVGALALVPAPVQGALQQLAGRAGRRVQPTAITISDWPALAREAFQAAEAPVMAAPPPAVADQSALVSALEKAFAALGDGNFTYRLELSDAAHAGLASQFNGAVLKLGTLVADMAALASDISLQSGEIAKASEDLAKRTETNASQLEQGSNALTQVDGRIQDTAQKARATASLATSALGGVNQGHAVAQDAVAAMERVQTSATGIANVIGGLDKIAFQTRVLAMNAAIEASRAGEAGRGFTVVADLVNALAQRAKEEAGNARNQLKATQTDIATAVGAVRRMDEALNSISGEMTEVDQLLKAIADDNLAQSNAISQASGVIRAMDSATQQNAATAEETAAAARHLHDYVASLASLTRGYRFDGQAKAARPAVAAQPAAKPAPVASPASPKPVVAKPAAAKPVATTAPLPANVVPLKTAAASAAAKPVVAAAKLPVDPLPAPRPAAAPKIAVAAAAGPKGSATVSHAAVTEDDDWQDF